MKLKHSGNHYEWWTDSFMGVGRFIRKEDQAVSFLETGMEFVEVEEIFDDLFSEIRGKDTIPPEIILDGIAAEYTFEKE